MLDDRPTDRPTERPTNNDDDDDDDGGNDTMDRWKSSDRRVAAMVLLQKNVFVVVVVDVVIIGCHENEFAPVMAPVEEANLCSIVGKAVRVLFKKVGKFFPEWNWKTVQHLAI